MGIAEEVAGFCDKEEFIDVYEQAITECGCGCKAEHNVLLIDTSPHKGNSHFRKNMNCMITPRVATEASQKIQFDLNNNYLFTISSQPVSILYSD